MTKQIVSEIEIVPIKPVNGLVAFASFILYESVYCGSIGVITRPLGGYRLLYPTKKVGSKNLSIYYPIDKEVGLFIEQEVSKKVEEVMKQNNDGYSSDNTT